MKAKEIENLLAKVNWSSECITEYRKKDCFSPMDVLMGKTDKETRYFIACCEFEEALNKAVEDFVNARDKIAREGR